MTEYEVTIYVNDREVLTRRVRAVDPEQAEIIVRESLVIEADVNDI